MDERRPPAIAGVSPGTVLTPAAGPATVLDFLAGRFAEVPHEVWRERMRRGRVLDADGAALSEDTCFVPLTRLHYYREIEDEPRIPFTAEIIHLDERLLIADKPHFLPVVPSGRFVGETLLARLRHETGLEHLSPLHRIDRGTAGLVAFAVDPRHRGAYQRLFATRAMRKVYEAIAPTLPSSQLPSVHRSRMVAGEPFFRMREIAGEPNSETRIEMLEARGTLARYRLRPLTGRKHQLRVHLAGLGAPIIGDDFYPELRVVADDDFSQPLQLLAQSLGFDDPLDGRPRQFHSRRSLTLPMPPHSG